MKKLDNGTVIRVAHQAGVFVGRLETWGGFQISLSSVCQIIPDIEKGRATLIPLKEEHFYLLGSMAISKVDEELYKAWVQVNSGLIFSNKMPEKGLLSPGGRERG